MLEWTTLAVAVPTLAFSYIVFGIAGFGAALIAAPILAHVMPVSTIVPLLALLDCASATISGVKLSRKIDKDEIKWLAPLMMLGSAVGVTVLLNLPTTVMAIALGLFVIAFAVYTLVAPVPKERISKAWIALVGPLGGIFSGMFGAGGPVYGAYLSRRLDDVDAYRGTQLTLIGIATFTRAVLFLIAGVYADLDIILLAACLVPSMIVGTWLAHWLSGKLSRKRFMQVLCVVLIGAGMSLIVRAWAAW